MFSLEEAVILNSRNLTTKPIRVSFVMYIGNVVANWNFKHIIWHVIDWIGLV